MGRTGKTNQVTKATPARQRATLIGISLFSSWFLVWSFQWDVALGMDQGSRTGWWTARTVRTASIRGQRMTSYQLLWLRPTDEQGRSLGAAYPVGGYTPAVFERVQKEALLHRVPVTLADPEMQLEEYPAPGDSTQRVFGRARHAGLGRHVIYRFDALPPPAQNGVLRGGADTLR